MSNSNHGLARKLGGWQLWGIAVGLVISGEYFGWSYGWAQAGTLGFLLSSVFVAIMYTAFIFSFTELTTAIPHAGGPFAYARRAFGPVGGFVAGFATLCEFVFAPPAIALAIGAYLNVQFPELSAKWIACGAYIVFMALNIVGVSVAAPSNWWSPCWPSLNCCCSWAWCRRASAGTTSPTTAGPVATASA
jgi:ethanolamine permease